MDLLIELIQVVLGQRDELSRTPSEEDWQRLFQMAEEQPITSFVFPALGILNKNGQKPPSELLYEWIGLAEQVKAQNVLMNREAARLTALFENEGHQTAILKGQANARLYNCHTESAESTERVATEGMNFSDLMSVRPSGVNSIIMASLFRVSQKESEEGPGH